MSKVLLIGWDAADWKVITPLIEAGKMPNIARLVREGCSSPIATLQPSFSPMLWTSIATGKRPFDHGIHGFTEPRQDGQGVQPVTNLSRKSKAIWNILGQSGMRSIVVGWWPSYPAEPIRGAMVSDQFHRVSTDFKLLPGMVHPAEYGEPLAALRLAPEDLPADLLEFFVPRASQIDQDRDRRLYSVAKVTCECANIHTAATWLMDHEALDGKPWDLCAVYFDAIDHYGHGFMKYNPPRQPWITEEDFDLYHRVLQAGYLLHDRMLGTLLEKAGPGATVILLSDHGFHPDHLRPTFIPEFHAGPVTEHRNNGVFVIAGPGIRPNAEIPGVTLLDIAPTILNLFGLPAGADMEGRNLAEAFEKPGTIARIPTWEKVEGDDGRHPPHMQFDPVAATESLEQLVALGYVEEPDADQGKAAKNTLTDLRTNLAEAYQDAGRHRQAAEILRELREVDLNDQRIALRLFVSAQALRQTHEMAGIAADWSGRRKEIYTRAMARLNELRNLARQSTEPALTPPALTPDERTELKKLRRACRYDPSLATWFQAQTLRARRRWSDALAKLDEIPTADLIRPGLFTDRAQLLGRLGRWAEAQGVLDDALSADPSDARVHFALARIHLHNRDFSASAHCALDGIGLLRNDSMGHYLLGIALVKLSMFSEATSAFYHAISANPNFPGAHLWLARMSLRGTHDLKRATQHGQKWQALRKNLPAIAANFADTNSYGTLSGPKPRPVAISGSARELPPITDETVIVSGLPRSGTSMLMQMLVAGGLTPLTDDLRTPDEDNPRGYFEFEPVRQMALGTSWFEQTRGKVVKIVVPLIPHLPEKVLCRVVLIERDINDILSSQRQMISRRSRLDVEETPARISRLKSEYLRMILWTKGFLATRPGTELMCLDRDAILRDPKSAADAMNRFLGGHLDAESMTAAVRPELNRHGSVQSVHRKT